MHIEAAREQDSIGWINFLFGRLLKKWRELQRWHLNHYYPTKHYSADAWIRRVITKIYRVTKSLWQFRCEFVHGIENVLTSKREKKVLEKEIKKQFRLGTDGVRGNDRHLLQRGLTAVLSATIREQKYWVRTLRLSRAYVLETEQHIFVGMRNILRKWTKPPD